MKQQFSDQELESIRKAVATAEAQCGAELVPSIRKQSAEYELTSWMSATILGGGALAIITLIWQLSDALLWWPFSLLAIVVLLAGMAGWLLGKWSPAFKRALAGKQLLTAEVDRTAHELFSELNVSATSDRLGVLLYFSLFERRLEILPDIGFQAHLGADDWDELVHDCLPYFKNEASVAAAIEATILKVGGFLAELDLAAEAGNELDDELHVDEG